MIQILCVYPSSKPEIYNHFTKQEEVDNFIKDRPERFPVYEIHTDEDGSVRIGEQI